jgi:hypothetical protein
MIVRESQILQVSLFETIQRNLARLDFGAVLTDIMLIADEVDAGTDSTARYREVGSALVCGSILAVVLQRARDWGRLSQLLKDLVSRQSGTLILLRT